MINIDDPVAVSRALEAALVATNAAICVLMPHWHTRMQCSGGWDK